jgi:hypothetical protein
VFAFCNFPHMLHKETQCKQSYQIELAFLDIQLCNSMLHCVGHW